MQALAKIGDMLRGIFRITEVCDEKFRRSTIEDRGERLLPYYKINIRWRCCRHNIRAIRDADSGGVACECHAILLIKIRDMVRRVARSINNIKFSRAHGKSFSAI